MKETVKRIVCGLNKQGKSETIACDEFNLNTGPGSIHIPGIPSAQAFDFFYTEDHPQSISTVGMDGTQKNQFHINLPKKSYQFIMIKFPPTKTIIDDVKKENLNVTENYQTFALHKTDTIDYCMIISGSILAIIGDNETNTVEHELKQGDVIIIGGAMHTWYNKTNTDCYMVAAKVGI